MEKFQHLKCLFIIFGVVILMIYLYGKIDFTPGRVEKVDAVSYINIAKESPAISETIKKPHAYRILGPYIVGLLPIPVNWGFYLFAISASMVLVTIFYFFLCDFNIPPSHSMFSTILFVFNSHFFGFTIWDYYQINDLLSLIFIVAIFWSILKNRWGVFSLFLFLGSLTRESSMIMIPTAFFFLWEKKKLTKEVKYFIIASFPAIISFILIRLLIKTEGGLGLFDALLFHGRKVMYPETWFRLLVNSFIPLSFLPFIFSRTSISFFKDKRYMLVFFFLVLASTFFGNNNERLMSPTSVIFYLLIAYIIRDYIYSRKAILFVILAGTFLSTFHHVHGRYLLPSRNLTMLLTMFTLIIITIITFKFKITIETKKGHVN